MAVALRPATPAGSEFRYRLHEAAMGGHVTAVWGWGEQVKREFRTRAPVPAAGRSSPRTGKTPACPVWTTGPAASTWAGSNSAAYRPPERAASHGGGGR